MLQELINLFNKLITGFKYLTKLLTSSIYGTGFLNHIGKKSFVKKISYDLLKDLIYAFNNQNNSECNKDLSNPNERNKDSDHKILEKAFAQSQLDFMRHGPYVTINGKKFSELCNFYTSSSTIPRAKMSELYQRCIKNDPICKFIECSLNQTYFEGISYQIICTALAKPELLNDANSRAITQVEKTGKNGERFCALKITQQSDTICTIKTLNRINIFKENIDKKTQSSELVRALTLDFMMQFEVQDIGNGKVSVDQKKHDLMLYKSTYIEGHQSFIQKVKDSLAPLCPKYTEEEILPSDVSLQSFLDIENGEKQDSTPLLTKTALANKTKYQSVSDYKYTQTLQVLRSCKNSRER